MTHRDPGPTPPDGDAVYVFAVRPREPSEAGSPPGAAGIPGGGRVRLLPLGELAAVVQTVPAADFTEEAWQARLADREQLERYARAHHRVVSAAAEEGPVVPLPLATLYHGESRARAALTAESGRFRAALERTADHAEWGVKVYATRPATAVTGRSAPAAVRPAERAGPPPPGAGLAYLERRRAVRARREEHQDEALRVAEAVYTEFGKMAAASRRLRAHTPGPAGDRRTQVLNATYLVRTDRAVDLAPLARALGERTGARIELSGPWVPYSFVGEV
ncbi:GvpL/GvpF family gas vesicle protein [Streptomyces sp. SID8352]|uniref:GvpL/GvpF family gas vesicle protein n=1 Tax=Streptomyces sp. SID8352 TaxID=2690338 RepID=UPI0013694DD7|nr:GvpL/GvpF family gas vesicle protein [Streptomyces sp. SID8352]MYU25260.1 gas vesicle protein [Streptomyces sp. SID8352]